jgi:hypothetical protein
MRIRFAHIEVEGHRPRADRGTPGYGEELYTLVVVPKTQCAFSFGSKPWRLDLGDTRGLPRIRFGAVLAMRISLTHNDGKGHRPRADRGTPVKGQGSKRSS